LQCFSVWDGSSDFILSSNQQLNACRSGELLGRACGDWVNNVRMLNIHTLHIITLTYIYNIYNITHYNLRMFKGLGVKNVRDTECGWFTVLREERVKNPPQPAAPALPQR
jgi:hypothetical protein